MRINHIWLFCVLVSCAAASGQIINTLRGWEDPNQGLTVQLEGGITLSQGNTEHLNLRAGGTIQLLTGKHRLRFMASEVYHKASGEMVAEDFRVHLRHNYALSELFSSLIFIQDQYNPFQRLESRALLGGGVRADLIEDSTTSLAVGGSVMLESIRLTGSSERTRNTRGSFFTSLIWKPLSGSVIDLSGFYQPLLPDFDHPLIMAALNMEAALISELSLYTGVQISYDSQPPDSVETTDLTVTSGLKLSI